MPPEQDSHKLFTAFGSSWKKRLLIMFVNPQHISTYFLIAQGKCKILNLLRFWSPESAPMSNNKISVKVKV
jgi:hypothetical protein